MTEAIEAYRHVSATDEFREIERLRALARHNEASALHHARNEGWTEGRSEGEQIGARRERQKWKGKVKEQTALWKGKVKEQAALWEGKVKEQAALIARLQAKFGIDK